MASIARRDNPVQLRERIDRGDVVATTACRSSTENQGNTGVPRTRRDDGHDGDGPQPLTTEQIPAELLGALSLTPDVWAKFYYKALTLEFEGIGVFGRIHHPGVLATDNQAGHAAPAGLGRRRRAPAVPRLVLRGPRDGRRHGRSGRGPGPVPQLPLEVRAAAAGDHAINDFHFSPDYHVDEILFRHIMGTVTNAIYVKPQAAYWFDLGRTRAVGINGSLIFSMAQVPVSTPGNSLNYGLEATWAPDTATRARACTAA